MLEWCTYSIVFVLQEKKSEVIDLDDEEEIDDVEKEVIDLDTPKKDKKEEVSKRTAEESSEEPEAKKVKADEEKEDWISDEV